MHTITFPLREKLPTLTMALTETVNTTENGYCFVRLCKPQHMAGESNESRTRNPKTKHKNEIVQTHIRDSERAMLAQSEMQPRPTVDSGQMLMDIFLVWKVERTLATEQ